MTPADYIARYEADCPRPVDMVRITQGMQVVQFSTPELEGRARQLVERLQAIRAQVDQCASLPGSSMLVFEITPSGIAGGPDQSPPDCQSNRCLFGAFTGARLEEAVQSPIAVELVLRSSPDMYCGKKPKGVASLPKDDIQRVIRDHRAEITECYESALDTWGEVRGRVHTRFEITNDGSVGSATVVLDDTLVPPLGCCVASRVKRWRFPPPKGTGSVLVNYPWVFRTQGQ